MCCPPHKSIWQQILRCNPNNLLPAHQQLSQHRGQKGGCGSFYPPHGMRLANCVAGVASPRGSFPASRFETYGMDNPISLRSPGRLIPLPCSSRFIALINQSFLQPSLNISAPFPVFQIPGFFPQALEQTVAPHKQEQPAIKAKHLFFSPNVIPRTFPRCVLPNCHPKWGGGRQKKQERDRMLLWEARTLCPN